MRSIVSRLLLPAVALLTTLAALELGLRLFQPPLSPKDGYHTSRWAEPDPVLGWRMRPGSWPVDILDRPMTVLPDGTRRTLPPPEGAAAQTPGGLLPGVLLVGGSYALGYGVEDQETLTSHLQKLRPDMRIVNAAVPGYGTWQSFLRAADLLRREGQPRPEVVVYGFGEHHLPRNIDDLDWIRSLRSYSGGQVVHPHLAPTGNGWKPRPPERINLLGLADDLYLVRQAQQFLLQQRFSALDGSQHRGATLEALERFASWSEEQGLRLVVASLLCGDCAWLEAWCSQRGVGFVDAAPPAQWQDPAWFITDGQTVSGHPNARFHAQVAQKLAPAL